MKVCLISNSDGRGGGYAAAYRLHQALQLSSTSTTMIVGEKTRSDYTVLSESSKLSKLSKKFVTIRVGRVEYALSCKCETQHCLPLQN